MSIATRQDDREEQTSTDAMLVIASNSHCLATTVRVNESRETDPRVWVTLCYSILFGRQCLHGSLPLILNNGVRFPISDEKY